MKPIIGFDRPALILDKSAFHALSKEEHGAHLFRYRNVLTPVLLREILADLAKDTEGLQQRWTPDKLVSVLAGKFCGSGGVLTTDYRKCCAGELLGSTRILGDGRPLVDQFMEDGDSVVIEVTPEQHAVMRWATAEFTEHERRTAAGLREEAASFTVASLYGRLRTHYVPIPRPNGIPDIAEVTDAVLATPTLQRALVEWLTEQLGLPVRLRTVVMERWMSFGGPTLASFAPYAFHCARALMLLLVGMRHKLLSDRRTNRIDIEYFFYMPFCEVFVSDDKLHRQLAPFLIRPGQRFVKASCFKAEMRQLLDAKSPAAPDEIHQD